jgi:nicotinamidase-related amidase
MKPTVSIDQCLIVFFESQRCMENGAVSGALERFQVFANELAIPSHAVAPSGTETNKIESALRFALDNAQSKGFGRLLIAGGTLESEVTILAMNGLAHGFDVYLLGDMLIQTDNGYSNLYWNRLIQAGVVPTTMVQMIAEWIASESNEMTASKISSAAMRFELAANK